VSVTQMQPSHSRQDAGVCLDGDSLYIRSVTITHPEAVSLARQHVTDHGEDSLTDLVGRALPIGIVALTLGGKGMNTSSIQRTFDAFGAQVSAASTSALAELDKTTTALRLGEQDLANRAQRVLERLPERVEACLAGASVDVRSQVAAATAEVQAAGLRDLRELLNSHSVSVRNALSLDTQEGPIKVLREEMLRMVDGARAELGAQLSAVQGLLIAAQAASAATASVKTTRASGLEFEAEAMALAGDVVASAGDQMDLTGSYAAPGSTSRAGDGVATLSHLITGTGRTVRVVLEAKTRDRPLTAAKWREELTTSRDLRDASGGLAIVPDASQVPGGRLFASVGERLFVVVADAPIVSLVYLVLRELVALATDSGNDTDPVSVSKASSRIAQALTALNDLEEITRHVTAATKSLEKIRDISTTVRTRVEHSLNDGLTALRKN
jgi:hypothetical protein